MPYKDGKYYDSGSNKKETWSGIRDGAVQGAREFFKSPVKGTLRARDDFNQASDLSSAYSRSSGNSGSGGGIDSKNNGAYTWSRK